MWHSQSISSLKGTKHILEYLCISPFRGRPSSQCAYYISFVLVYGIVFFATFYHSMIYSGDLNSHMEHYDTFYVARHIKRFSRGPFVCIVIILSMCSRSDQLKLQKRMADLDIKLRSNLGVGPSFRRLNIDFIVCAVFDVVYIYGGLFYLVHSDFDLEYITSHTYYCCTVSAAVYFYLYGLYTIYWARAYVNRSEYIIDALNIATSQEFMSSSSLSIILELINLLFQVHESIENAFGSILFSIILVTTLESSQGIFSIIHIYEREREQTHLWWNYLVWSLVLWLEFVFIFISFTKIGDVVSKSVYQ